MSSFICTRTVRFPENPSRDNEPHVKVFGTGIRPWTGGTGDRFEEYHLIWVNSRITTSKQCKKDSISGLREGKLLPLETSAATNRETKYPDAVTHEMECLRSTCLRCLCDACGMKKGYPAEVSEKNDFTGYGNDSILSDTEVSGSKFLVESKGCREGRKAKDRGRVNLRRDINTKKPVKATGG